MTSIQNQRLRYRLRKFKAGFLAVALTLAGVLLIALNGWLARINLGDWAWVHQVPLGELGGVLFGAGLLSTLFEYTFRKDQGLFPIGGVGRGRRVAAGVGVEVFR